MIKRIFPLALMALLVCGLSNTSFASLVLLIDDDATAGIDVVVIDNAPAGTTSSGGLFTSTIADSNATLGGVVFNGDLNNFELVVTTGASKPLLTGNTIDLNSIVAAFDPAGGGLSMLVLDTGFVDNGYGFRTEIGGTTNGTVEAVSLVSPDNAEGNFGVVSASPVFGVSPFMWADEAQVSVDSVFGMAVEAKVELSGAGMTSFDLSFQQVPEPTTALIWTMLAGVGLIGRRRRSF